MGRSAAGPIAMTALPGVSAATVGWRRQGQDFVTAVIKVTCALQSNRPMAPVAPDPITADEQPFEGGVGLRSAGDLAPYLAKTDVCLVGHAKAPPGTTRAAVRLGVLREGAPLLDTWVELEASAPGGEVVITGMGPIAADWPLRSRLLGGASLKGPLLDLPSSLDWAYFQAAPLDQQIAHLHGDEWIGISGVDAGGAPWMTRLPEAKAALRLYGRAEALRAGKPIAVTLDTLLLDVDRRRAVLAWRGHIPISSGTDLSSLHFMAALEQRGRLTPWADPFASEAASMDARHVAFVPPARSAAPKAAVLPAHAMLPSKAPRGAPPPNPPPPPNPAPALRIEGGDHPLEGTMDVGAYLRSQSAPPLGPPRSLSPQPFARVAPPAPPVPAIEDHPLAGTREVTSAAPSEVMPFRPSDRPPPPARPASIPPPPPPAPARSFSPQPFARVAPPAPLVPAIEDHPLAGTREVSSVVAKEVIPFRPSDKPPPARPASIPPPPAPARSFSPQPFARVAPPAPPVPAIEDHPLAGTRELTSAAPKEVLPFSMVVPFSPHRAEGAESGSASPLGEQFLAGMAEAMAAGHVLEEVVEG